MEFRGNREIGDEVLPRRLLEERPVAELAEGIKQLIYIGSMVMSADATTTVQVAFIGVFSPPTRYGSLIVINESGAAHHSDAVESHIVFDPIVDEIAT